jgi:hypothetical protein
MTSLGGPNGRDGRTVAMAGPVFPDPRFFLSSLVVCRIFTQNGRGITLE